MKNWTTGALAGLLALGLLGCQPATKDTFSVAERMMPVSSTSKMAHFLCMRSNIMA